MTNKMQVLAGVLVGSVGFVTIMSIIPSFIRDLDNRVRSIYYEEIVSPYYKWIQSKDKDIKGDGFPEDSVSQKQQKVLRVWRGNPNDTVSKSVCGIYTPPDEINNLQNQGWSIKTSQPINYRLEQYRYAFNCLGSETVLEK